MLFDDKQFENEEYWEYATIPPEYDVVATILEETEIKLFVEEQPEKLEL